MRAGPVERAPTRQRFSSTLAGLVDQGWVLPAYASGPGALIQSLFVRQGLIPPEPTVETFSVVLSATTVSSTRLIGILPRSVLHFLKARFGLTTLALELIDVQVGVRLVTLKNRTLSPLAERFIECAKEASASMARG